MSIVWYLGGWEVARNYVPHFFKESTLKIFKIKIAPGVL